MARRVLDVRRPRPGSFEFTSASVNHRREVRLSQRTCEGINLRASASASAARLQSLVGQEQIVARPDAELRSGAKEQDADGRRRDVQALSDALVAEAAVRMKKRLFFADREQRTLAFLGHRTPENAVAEA